MAFKGSMKVSYKVNPSDERALDNMMARLKGLPKVMERYQDTIAEQTVKQMKKDALLLGVYDTGNLYNHIKYVPKSHSNGVAIEFESVAIDPETGEDYAPLQVFGSRYQRARDYFYPNVKQYVKHFGQAVSGWLRDQAKKGAKKIGYYRFHKYKGLGY